VSWSNKNVYADLSGGTAISRSTRMWAEMFAPDGHLLPHSIEKLCFASDVTYFRDETPRFGPYIAFYERIFGAIDLPAAVRERVNRGNACHLFGLNVSQYPVNRGVTDPETTDEHASRPSTEP
jgi:hypothetical protein